MMCWERAGIGLGISERLTLARFRVFSERRWWQRPAFVQRRMHPMNNDFSQRNRLIGCYSFNHNMAKVFTPEVMRVTLIFSRWCGE